MQTKFASVQWSILKVVKLVLHSPQGWTKKYGSRLQNSTDEIVTTWRVLGEDFNSINVVPRNLGKFTPFVLCNDINAAMKLVPKLQSEWQ